MALITTFQRYEKKFLLARSIMKEILPVIEEYMEPDAYCVGGNRYTIYNLYYDTEQDDVVKTSLLKPFYKEKLRMRCYEIPRSEEDLVFLELKKKINKMVAKRRVRLSYREAKDFLREGILPEDDSYMTQQVLKEIQYYLSHTAVEPSTLITYDRVAYFGREDAHFRLTFDQNIRYWKRGDRTKEISFDRMQDTKSLLSEDMCLMEVKVREAFPYWLSQLLGRYELSPVSFSKYGNSYKMEEVLL